MRTFRFTFTLGLLALGLFAPSANAFLMYLETGVGAGTLISASPTFPSLTSTVASPGLSYNGGLHFALGNGSGPIDVHLGAKFRSTSANFFTGLFGATPSYQLLTVYPEIKVQFSILYLALGLSPLVWTRQQPFYGLDSITSSGPKLTYVTEVGILYSWTRMFTIGGAVTAQFIGPLGFFAGPVGPMPAIDAQFIMRFYLWTQDISVGTATKMDSKSITPNEYKGWRYPGGWSK